MDHNLGANPEDLHSMFTNTFAKASSGTYGGGPATPDSRAYTPQSNSGAGYVDEFGMSMGATVPGQYPMSSQQWPQQQAYQGSDLDFPSSNGYHRGGGGGGGAVSDGYGTDPTFAYEAQSPHQTASSSLHHHQHQQQPQQTSHHQQQQQQHMMPSYPSMHAQPDHQQQYNNSWATQQSYLPQQQQQQQQPTHQPLSGPSFPQQPVSSSNGPKIKQENYALEENLMVAGLLPVQPQASVASTSSSIASAPNPSESDFYSSVKPSPGMSLGSPSGTQTPLSSVSGDSLPGKNITDTIFIPASELFREADICEKSCFPNDIYG